MFRKIFTFSNATLLVALTLSTIAAWYSIIGLTAIFAGAVVPIIIMGTALEFAKITTTVWLRKYWHRCSLIMKVYLVPAVVLLALLTSMGIFGFLSKAHLDQNIGSGDVQAQVSLLDEKIATQRENVRSSKAMLAQMDQQVNDIMTKGDSERAVERSVAIRKQQAKERVSLQKDIEVANKEIQRLNEERAPIASELRKVEAEVGPIKYIAALIYGDNADNNMLEAAVRWVIILLVVVFDPLAIMLVLAANQSKDWDDEPEATPVYVADVTMPEPGPGYEQDDGPLTEEQVDQLKKSVEAFGLPQGEVVVKEELFPEESILDKHPYLNQPFAHFENTKPLVHKPEVVVPEETIQVEEQVEQEENKILAIGVDVIDRPGDYIEPPATDDSPQFEGVKVNGEWVQTGPALEEPPKPYIKPLPYRKAEGDYVEFEGKGMHVRVLREMHPEFFLEDDAARKSRASFGAEFPVEAKSGDTFVRVDVVPNRIYKFNGVRWIETQRDLSDTHLTNDDYLQFLVDKIATGEYDPEILTENEQDAVQNYIKIQK